MLHYIIGLTFLKSVTPYFRKFTLDILHAHELLFLNTLFIGIIVSFFFLYKFLTDKHFYKFTNFKKLNWKHFGCIFAVSLLTVFSTIFIYDLDKNFSTPFLNNIFMKVGSIVFLFLISSFLFKEKYTMKQIIGIIVTIFGVYLIAGDKMD
jgi:drug/metabolite transporter (DMT)-like permease